MANRKDIAQFRQGLQEGVAALSSLLGDAKTVVDGAAKGAATADQILAMVETGQIGLPFEAVVDVLSATMQSAFPKPRQIRKIIILGSDRGFRVSVVYNGAEEEVLTTTDEGKAQFAAKLLSAWKLHGGS